MRTDGDRVPLTTTAKVLIAIGLIGAAFLLFFVLIVNFPNLVGPIIGDPAGSVVAITNDCGQTLFVSDASNDQSTATSAAYYAVEAGDTYSESPGAGYSARVYGGLWSPAVMPDGEMRIIGGADCPIAATPTQLATVRTPMLANTELVAADVASEGSVEDYSVGSEVTTIVATVTPEQAKAWQVEFAMVPSGGSAGSSDPMLAAAFPGATWYESSAFDSAIPADGLKGYAYVDLETGTVVARVRDDRSAS